MHTLPEAQSPADKGILIAASREQAGKPEEKVRSVSKNSRTKQENVIEHE